LGIVRDPTGAILTLWQPKQEIGARFKNIPSSLCWNELVTTDAERSKYFFSHLLGWESHITEMPNLTYTTFLVDDKPVAGMYQMPDAIEDVPSHWLPYFSVADCDASCAKAQELGAAVLKSPTDIPGTGRYAVLQDPQGAAFAILKMEPMEDEPE
jgi:predicted enzyme related to lactoylglutathione lyase